MLTCMAFMYVSGSARPSKHMLLLLPLPPKLLLKMPQFSLLQRTCLCCISHSLLLQQVEHKPAGDTLQ